MKREMGYAREFSKMDYEKGNENNYVKKLLIIYENYLILETTFHNDYDNPHDFIKIFKKHERS